MKKWNPWVRFIWDHWNMDTITWEQRAEAEALGYATELEEFAEENPRPRLCDYMTGLSGQWRYQTGMERAA